MPLTSVRRYSFEECIHRAQTLFRIWPSAAEVLQTLLQVLQFQGSLQAFLERSKFHSFNAEQTFPWAIDLFPLLPHFRTFLQIMAASNSPTLAEKAEKLKMANPDVWEEHLQRYWTHANQNVPSTEAFFLRAFLQPIAEYLAEESAISTANYARSLCPYCGRKPACGVLRPEGDGAKRSLICSFCSSEWEYRRIVCPACEQQDVERLPVYTAEDCAYIRMEACDVCKTFIKTIDLTKDGRAIPLIDEIGSLPLTLWAQERGYSKLERNLLLL